MLLGVTSSISDRQLMVRVVLVEEGGRHGVDDFDWGVLEVASFFSITLIYSGVLVGEGGVTQTVVESTCTHFVSPT